MTIKLEIWSGDELLFGIYPNGTVQVPTNEDERTSVFEAICEAYSILAGIQRVKDTPKSDEAVDRGPVDSDRNVVSLSERRDA